MSEASTSMKLVKKPAGKSPPAKTDPTAAIAGQVAKATAPAPASIVKKPAVAAVPTPAPVTKTVVKTAPAVAQTTEVEAETAVDSADMIVKVAHEIENAKSEKAFAAIPKLLDNIDGDYFKLGGYLSVIQAQGWFMEKGYENFRAWVEAECAIEYRKAMYLIAIYNGLVVSGVSWAEVGHLGWTKLKELASILTQENVADLVAKAESLTTIQLIEHVKSLKVASNTGAVSAAPDTVSATTTMTLKLHSDQKTTIREAIDKGKAQMNTDHDAVALEHICLDYLAGDGKVKTAGSLTALMKNKTAEEVLTAFGEVFPTVNIEATLAE